MAKDRLVHRALESGLVGAVERGQPDHRLVALAPQVDVPVHRDLTHRQGPGLVAAEDVHAAEVLDGRELLDDDLLLRHADRPARQGDRDDHGQELGRQPDREGDGEQERLQQIPAQHRVDQEHEQHEEHDDLEDQEAELPGAALELGLGRTTDQLCRDTPELRGGTRRLDTGDADAAHHRRAAEETGAGVSLGRQRLSGERRLVQEEILGGHERHVGRHEIPRREVDDVAGDHGGCRDLAHHTVARDPRALTDTFAEPACRDLGTVRLDEVQRGPEQNHQPDDDGAHHLAQGGRHHAREQQDGDEWAREPARDPTERLEPARKRQLVGAVAPEALGGLGRGQAFGCSLTIRTGHRASRSTFSDTEPSRSRATPPRPRAPTTTRSVS
jgi:hypothetical protein